MQAASLSRVMSLTLRQACSQSRKGLIFPRDYEHIITTVYIYSFLDFTHALVKFDCDGCYSVIPVRRLVDCSTLAPDTKCTVKWGAKLYSAMIIASGKYIALKNVKPILIA